MTPEIRTDSLRPMTNLQIQQTREFVTSLDEVWAPWWRALAEQGHAFASHTFDHVYWLSATADGRF